MPAFYSYNLMPSSSNNVPIPGPNANMYSNGKMYNAYPQWPQFPQFSSQALIAFFSTPYMHQDNN